ncbi:MAG: hypothetical protein ABSG68_19495, partial [Thermoguttaceae bacterium]
MMDRKSVPPSRLPAQDESALGRAAAEIAAGRLPPSPEPAAVPPAAPRPALGPQASQRFQTHGK